MAPARAAAASPRGASWFRLPRWQPAFALAALIVVGFAGAAVWRANAPAPATARRRGAQAQSFAALPERAVGGGLELGWSAAPGADGYAVVFLDSLLREIARSAPLKDTHCRLDAAALPAGLTHGAEGGVAGRGLRRHRLDRPDEREGIAGAVRASEPRHRGCRRGRHAPLSSHSWATVGGCPTR